MLPGMYAPGRGGLQEPTEKLAKAVRSLIHELGPRAAAAKLKLSREACLMVGCRALVSRGSIALAEKAVAEASQSESAGT